MDIVAETKDKEFDQVLQSYYAMLLLEQESFMGTVY